MSDIFDDVSDANAMIEETKTKRAPKRRAKKVDDTPDAAPVKILEGKPEDDKSNWVTIYIDEEAGQSNYVPVGYNGTVYQIMRGVDVKVPRNVVNVLKDAIAHRVVQVVDPATGKKENVLRPYNAIPFRVIG